LSIKFSAFSKRHKFFLVKSPEVFTARVAFHEFIIPFLLNFRSDGISWQVLQESDAMSLNLKEVVVLNNDFLEVPFEHSKHLFQAWVERVGESNFSGQFVTHPNVAVPNNSRSHVVGHFASSLITDPSVNTSSTREDPQHVLKVKVFVQDLCKDFHRNFEISEATLANIGSSTARTDIIVRVHVNIKDHLFLCWHKCSFVTSVVAVGRDIVDGPNVDFERHSIDQSCFQPS